MRHRVAFRKLGRVTEHRIAMLRSQAQALLLHEHIETTVPKAKELRPFVERLITVAKRGIADGAATRALTARREVLKDITNRDVVGKLFTEIAPRFAARPGGYTRLLRVGYRQGDAAEVARVELVGSEFDPKKAKAEAEAKEGEKSAKAKGVGGRLRAAADRLRGKQAAEAAEGESAAVETKSQARAAARKGSGGARRAPGGKGTK
jgi:large subunit ribosomal protein L17